MRGATHATRVLADLNLPTSRWGFPSPDDSDGDDIVAIGADLEPETLISAYCAGLFPMPVGRRKLGWFSPHPRAVLPTGGLRVSRSLRRSLRRFEVVVDRDFEGVVRRCADPKRPNRWINEEFVAAYCRLAELGCAHSVECYQDDELVGGLYGVCIGGFFAGESMFHRRADASKVALVHLAGMVDRVDSSLLDVQWSTPHLESLGVTTISRFDYLERLDRALGASPIAWDGLGDLNS